MALPVPRQAASRYQVALVALDVLWALVALGVTWWLMPHRGPELIKPLGFALVGLLAGMWILATWLIGQYSIRPWRPAYLTVLETAEAVALGTAAILAVSFLLGRHPLIGRVYYLSASLMMWPLMSAARLALLRLVPRAAFVERYLLLGTGERAQAMAEALRRAAATELVGAVAMDGEQGEVPAAGHLRELPELIPRLGATHAVLCADHGDSDLVARAVAECEVRGLRVESMAHAYERVTEQAPVFAAGAEWLSGVETRPGSHYASRLKRALDVTVSLAVLPLAALLVGLSAVAIKLTSPGPVLYAQTRVGGGGREFAFVKLRTMVIGAERETGPVWATRDDPRITRVGRCLRRTGIDELPQLWSVLKGEMSLVGPRPERPHFVEQFIERIPYYKLRLLAAPGITGWAQVHQGADRTEGDVQEKLAYDLYYVRHLSFALDLQVLARTVGVLIRGPGEQ